MPPILFLAVVVTGPCCPPGWLRVARALCACSAAAAGPVRSTPCCTAGTAPRTQGGA